MIKMVFDRILIAPGDKQDLLNAVSNEFLDNVLDNRLAGDRKHLLGLRFCGRQQPGAVARNRNDSALDHLLTIEQVEPVAATRYSDRRKSEDGGHPTAARGVAAARGPNRSEVAREQLARGAARCGPAEAEPKGD